MISSDKIDKIIENCLQKQRPAGLSVAVTDAKETLYAKGFGVNSVEIPNFPALPQSRYRIASISKMITCITVMRLVQDGILSLDEPVKIYLPWLKLSREQAEKTVTLRHLLSHTSGLPVEYTPVGDRDEYFSQQSLKEGLPGAQMASLPGEGVFLYSNWGFRLAACVAQSVTNKMFSALANELAIRPLGMDETTYSLCEAATYPLSLPHVIKDGALVVEHLIKQNAVRYAAGGLYSTVSDLCILARFYMNDGLSKKGERLLKPEYVSLMRTQCVDVNAKDYDGYGLAVQLRRANGLSLYGHMGDNSPYMGSLWIEPKSGYAVAVEMNTALPELRVEIADAIFDQIC